MRSGRPANRASLIWGGNDLFIALPEVVNTHSLDDVLAALSLPLRTPDRIILNMERVRLVRPGGACQLVCFASWLNSVALPQRRPLIITGLSNGVASFLATTGFFSVLWQQAGLQEAEELLRLENQRRSRRRERDREKGFHLDHRDMVLLPFGIFPKDDGTNATSALANFENACLSFVNSAAKEFEHLFKGGFFQFDVPQQDFWAANVELIKNIFQHSRSWGLGVVFATRNGRPAGAVISYHDIGIGIPASVKSLGGSMATVTDEEAILWAIEERHTSRPGNSGLGFTIVAECVSQMGGTIEIRSGNTRLTGSGSRDGWSITSVPPFVGTHVSFFAPASPK